MKPDSIRAKQIAEEHTVLRMESGSSLYGTAVDDIPDRDEVGICVEPPSAVIGLEDFLRYEYRSAGLGQRSGPDDLDLTIYSLRHWTSQVVDGSPNLVLMMYVPDSKVIRRYYPAGYAIPAVRDLLISKECGRRFMGYLKAQREQMLGNRTHTNRPELIEQYGYDTKFAYHAVRLGLQGEELLNTGWVNLPMLAPHRTYLKEVRLGLHDKEDVLDRINSLYASVGVLTDKVDLPDRPDLVKVNRWLTDVYQSWWEHKGLLT